MASHELRTPLTSILGYAKTLQRLEFSADEDARREFLGAIERQGGRLSKLVENLLTASELEGGWLEPSLEPVEFTEVVDAVAGAFGVEAARFRMELPSGLPPLVTDRRLLTLVVANLFDNALNSPLTGARSGPGPKERSSRSGSGIGAWGSRPTGWLGSSSCSARGIPRPPEPMADSGLA